ncbi:MAG: hypothetical protein ABIJ00_04970 [Candidatus Eisenbacteria bacterium]
MQKLLVWCLVVIGALSAIAAGTSDAARRTVLIEQAINAGCG